MKILLTGGAGNLGQHLLDALQKLEVEVRCLAHQRPVKNCPQYIYGDLEKPSTLLSALEGVDVVVHLAALTRTRKPKRYFTVNTTGTHNLLKASQKQSVNRFIHISTCSINPSGGPYSKSKLLAEKLVKQYKTLNSVIIRLPQVYGCGSEGLDQMLEWIRSNKRVFIVGQGDYAISPLHVTDVVQAIAGILIKHQIVGTYSLRGVDTSIKQFAKTHIEEQNSTSQITTVPLPLIKVLSALAYILPLPLYPDQLKRIQAPMEFAKQLTIPEGCYNSLPN